MKKSKVFWGYIILALVVYAVVQFLINGEILNFKNMSLVSKTLGISRASLYRALSDLEKSGYIIKENNYIKVIKNEKSN